MRINVTLDEIVNGIKADGRQCAVARALNTAGLPHVDVDDDFVRIFSYSPFFLSTHQLDTPEWLANWIKAFDNDELVEPFSFDLDLNTRAITKCEPPLLEPETRTADDLELVCV